MTTQQTGAEEVLWDLSDLYKSPADPALEHDLTTIVARADAFRTEWRGRIATASDQDIDALLRTYEELTELLDKMGSYTHLLWSTDTENPENGRLLQRVREIGTSASQLLFFVPIDFAALPTERLQALASSPLHASRAHWFERTQKYGPHMLDERLEQVLGEKALTARYAWVRLYDELQNAKVIELNGREYTESAILKLLYESDRSTRKAAAEAFSKGLADGVKTHAFIFNTVLADCASNDRMRNYPTWVSSRNLDNEVSDATVETLVSAVVDRYDLVHRFFALKKRLLGIEEMQDYDRYAPIGGDQTFWSWEDARNIVVKAYTDFHPEAGEIAGMFFDKSWIHAPVYKGKSGGAYSAGTVPSAHPYVFMNYMGTNRDVMTLAHELGHGIHQYLSRRQGILLADTPLTIAETASVFGEMVVFSMLMERTTDPQARLALLVGKIDDILATVFRQIGLNRFENAIHRARRSEGELTVDRLNELWMETQRAQFGTSVTLTENYRHWWSYISHFMHTPGYVYAYAFGELLVLALYEIYKRDGGTFPEQYMDLLRSGGSKSPEDLLSPLGLDINDPAFWNIGLSAIERLISEAEALAATT